MCFICVFVFIFISHNFLLASEAMFRIVFFPTEGKIYLPSELTCYTNSVTSLIAAVGRGLVLKICLQQLIPESQEKQPKPPPGCLTTDIQSLKPELCITLCPMLYPLQIKPWECLPSFLPLSQCNKTQQCYFRMLWYTSRSFLCFHIYNHFSPLNS